MASKAFAQKYTEENELVSLKAEVKELKDSNAQLSKSVHQSNANFERTSGMLAETILDLQS